MDPSDWNLPDWLLQDVAGNPVWAWLAAPLVALVVFLLLSSVRALVRRRGARWKEREERSAEAGGEAAASVLRPGDAIEALGATSTWLLLLVSLLAGSLSLRLDQRWQSLLHALTTVALVVQGGLWVSRLALVALSRVVSARRTRDPASVTGFTAIAVLLRGAIWVVVALLVLANLGVEVTGLVAGLGIGGIAIALAVQSVLSDLLASLTIVLDRPFEVGDFIIVGDLMGNVENVGLKTTRVRSLSGEQLVFANSDLLGSRIQNYKRMRERRVLFSFGVVYQTSAEELEAIPGLVRDIVGKQPKARFDRAHFRSYGESSLDFEVVYFMLVPDYDAMMDAQQGINLALFRAFAERGIEFAYPTRTLFVQREEPAEEAAAPS